MSEREKNLNALNKKRKRKKESIKDDEIHCKQTKWLLSRKDYEKDKGEKMY